MANAGAYLEPSTLEEELELAWILGNDGNWYLCCKCPLCRFWIEYPGFAHPCIDENTWHLPTCRMNTVCINLTSIEELTRALECDEADNGQEA